MTKGLKMTSQPNSAALKCFVPAVVVLLSVGLSQGGLLPNEICFPCAAFFRTTGCIGNESDLCKLVAFKLLLDVDGQQLCDERPCQGYGQEDTHTCGSIFNCPFDRLDFTGICNGFDFCCRNE